MVKEPVGPGRSDLSVSVSVVIAVRDVERYLGAALGSILDQTRPVDEIIVVDDGSTDSSADIADAVGHRVRVIRTEPRGVSAARNTGIAAASGEVIALCDADDLFAADKIERQLAHIDDVAAPIAVFCGMSEFISPELDPSAIRARAPQEFVARVRLTSGLLATRAAYDATGPFDTTRTVTDWVEWCDRLCDVADVRYADGVLLHRRIHDANASLRSGQQSSEWAHVLYDHLRRRRPA